MKSTGKSLKKLPARFEKKWGGSMKCYQKLTILLGLIWGFIAIQRIVIAIIMRAI
jgi:hypothetical protein